MGAAGLLIGGGVLTLGAASLMSKKSNGYGTAANAHSAMAVTHPAAPEAPTPVEGEGGGGPTTQKPLMEAEREKERQAALLRQQQAPEVFTSGLGAGGLAQTAKKSLLGE